MATSTTHLHVMLTVVNVFLTASLFIVIVVNANKNKQRRQSFVEEPPHGVTFLNSVGAAITCSGASPSIATHSLSAPSISWQLDDENLVRDIPELRYNKNGSLVFPPFAPQQYRHDVHSATYRCKTSYSPGVTISRPIKVKAVVKQPYEARVYDEFVMGGNTGVLKCLVPGYVSDHVTVVGWVREDNLVIDMIATHKKDRYTMFADGYLHISKVTISDGKFSYWCRTKYKLDEPGNIQLSETSGRLQITDDAGSSISPRVTHIADRIVTLSGQSSVLLPCAGQGNPAPKYVWTKKSENDKTSLLSDRVKIMDNTLIFAFVKKEDEGQYICQLYNDIGSDMKTTELIVREPLSAFIKPELQNVSAGDDLILSCSGEGSPINSIKWYKNGKILQTGNKKVKHRILNLHSILNISSVGRNDGGLYQCFVSNSWETIQSAAFVNLRDIPPEIESGFQERTLQPGPTVRLKCSVTGKPNPKIFWKLDNFDTVLNANPDKRFSVENKVKNGFVISEIVINNMRTEDGGEYQCVASNTAGNASHSARVNVYGLPSVRPMKNVKVIAGQDVNITCYASGYPIHQLFWMKGNRRTNGKILRITKVKKKHERIKYSCIAVGSGGKQSKQELMLNVLKRPEINLALPIEVTSGTEMSAFCTLTSGDKPIDMDWLKDGHPIKHHLGIITTKSSDYAKLEIHKVSQHHSGVYTCVATNEAGAVTKTATLTVTGSPLWIEKPKNLTMLQKKNIIIDCKAKGNPYPVMYWQKLSGEVFLDMNELDDRFVVFGNGSLRIKDSKKVDTGLYRCTASNGIPPDLFHTIKLKVGSIAVVQSLGATREINSGETLKIKCQTSSSEDAVNVKWFRNNDFITQQRFKMNQRSVSSRLQFMLELPNVLSSDSGVYGCVVSNEFGESSAKVDVFVREFELHQEDIQKSTTLQPIVKLITVTPTEVEDTTTFSVGTTVDSPNIFLNQTISSGSKEKEPSGGFRWKKYMLYYMVPAGIIILVLIIALVIVLCLLCCSNNRRKPKESRQIELHQKSVDDYKVSGCSEYDGTLVSSRYGKVTSCRDKRPLSGSYPNLPAGDKHYLGFSPYGTLEHQSSHYTPVPC